MRLVPCLALALACVAFPVRSETYRSAGPPFSITYPDDWKVLPGEGELRTRAVGPGGAMNVSIAAAKRPDFDADRFSDAQLLQIADGLAAAVSGALDGFELLERGPATLGGKRAAYFRYKAVVTLPKGRVETLGHYVATAHRGLVYSVTAVTQASQARRNQPKLMEAIASFRFDEGREPPAGP